MAIFLPSSAHSAAVTIDIDPAGLACQIEVYLALTPTGAKVATSGLRSFTSTGSAQAVACPITMPSTAGSTYHVYIDVHVAGQIAAQFVASEDVTVVSIGPPGVVWS